MIWIAIRMLTGDRQKFYGLVFGIAFSTLLITQQLTIFVNLLERGASGVYNVSSADVWVMDPVSRTTDVSYAMPSTALDKVRGVPGVICRKITRRMLVSGSWRNTRLIPFTPRWSRICARNIGS